MKLCINDYNIETVNPKSQAMAKVAAGLLAKGAPLHCIGQSAMRLRGCLGSSFGLSQLQVSNPTSLVDLLLGTSPRL